MSDKRMKATALVSAVSLHAYYWKIFLCSVDSYVLNLVSLKAVKVMNSTYMMKDARKTDDFLLFLLYVACIGMIYIHSRSRSFLGMYVLVTMTVGVRCVLWVVGFDDYSGE